MKKKLLLGLAAVLIISGGVSALSAWEAHVINVTAHIENALYVHPEEIKFGTVFPQEYLVRPFTIELSSSFQLQDPIRATDLYYKIVQKPKPIWPIPENCKLFGPETDIVEARAYCHDNPTDLTCCYMPLCPFLSKLPQDGETGDVGVPSYYVVDPTGGGADECVEPSSHEATGHLHITGDIADLWKVDLKVPPVYGYVGQDWPDSCATWVVDKNDKDYGCDLWIEVINITEVIG